MTRADVMAVLMRTMLEGVCSVLRWGISAYRRKA